MTEDSAGALASVAEDFNIIFCSAVEPCLVHVCVVSQS